MVKEAIVNAVIHRDYRLNRDIFIRVFDDRIEVESPGVFPGHITEANIARAGSKARNPLLALNLERPSAWDEVSDWIDRHGAIANADLCRIAALDTLKASKMLAAWREQGFLVPLPDRAKRNMAYRKPTQPAEEPDLLSEALDNKSETA